MRHSSILQLSDNDIYLTALEVPILIDAMGATENAVWKTRDTKCRTGKRENVHYGLESQNALIYLQVGNLSASWSLHVFFCRANTVQSQ